MSWIQDYDVQGDDLSYSITRDVLNDLCKKMVNMEEEILKAWFQMAFTAGKDYEDLPFEVWWDNFYKTLQQGAETDGD